MIYFETESTDAAYNLAFEEYIFQSYTKGDVLMLWQNDNAVIIGQNQNAYAEVNEEFIRKNDIRVVRRSSGGGAVYHDLGNLNYSFITDLGDPETLNIDRFTKPVVEALVALGLSAKASGRNDILVNEKKVSGTAQRITRGRVLHHGTLLFKSDHNMVAGALNVDPQKFRAKGSKSVKSRIGNISDYLDGDMTLQKFWDYLREYFAGKGAKKSRLSEESLKEVISIKNEKYDSWEWNYGRSKEFDLVNKGYFEGGILEVHVKTENGIINDIEIYGDFMSVKPLDEIKEALIGSISSYDSVQKELLHFNIKDYFGTITLEEVLSVIMGS